VDHNVAQEFNTNVLLLRCLWWRKKDWVDVLWILLYQWARWYYNYWGILLEYL